MLPDPVIFTIIACLGIFVFSFAGFAGGLTAIPLLAVFLHPVDFVPAMAISVQVVNMRMSWEARHHIDFSRIRWVLGSGLAGVPFGAWLLTSLSAAWMGLGIGFFSLTMGILFLFKVKVPMSEKVPVQILVGLTSGLLGGAATAAGPPVVFYALARGWKRDKFRSTLMVYFLCLSVLLISIFAARGMITSTVLTYCGVAIVPMFVVSRLGIWLKQQADESRFRLAILIVVTLVGIVGVIKFGRQVILESGLPGPEVEGAAPKLPEVREHLAPDRKKND